MTGRRIRKRSGATGVSTPRQPKGPRFPRFAADPKEASNTNEKPDIIEPQFANWKQLTPEQIAAIKAKQRTPAPASRNRKRR
jgi:hypothetical protein